MKAAICDRYGPPENVTLREVEKPVPGEDEILIRTRATTVNSGDARLRAARVPKGMGLMVRFGMGFTGPRLKVLGFESAGEVVETGRNVTRFRPGDRVLASNGFMLGGHAEYFRLDAKHGVAVKLPDTLSFEDAAALQFGGVTSLIFFEKGGLKAGERLLVNGASGAVGVLAVQIAKHMGVHVTAVCSGNNADLMRSLGADEVIDYTMTDIDKLTERYDVVMDNHGNAPYRRIKYLLKPGGRFLMVIGNMYEMIAGKFTAAVVNADDVDDAFSERIFQQFIDLAESGAIHAVIGTQLPFSEIVEAHRIVDTGHKVGALVLTLP